MSESPSDKLLRDRLITLLQKMGALGGQPSPGNRREAEMMLKRAWLTHQPPRETSIAPRPWECWNVDLPEVQWSYDGLGSDVVVRVDTEATTLDRAFKPREALIVTARDVRTTGIEVLINTSASDPHAGDLTHDQKAERLVDQLPGGDPVYLVLHQFRSLLLTPPTNSERLGIHPVDPDGVRNPVLLRRRRTVDRRRHNVVVNLLKQMLLRNKWCDPEAPEPGLRVGIHNGAQRVPAIVVASYRRWESKHANSDRNTVWVCPIYSPDRVPTVKSFLDGLPTESVARVKQLVRSGYVTRSESEVVDVFRVLGLRRDMVEPTGSNNENLLRQIRQRLELQLEELLEAGHGNGN